MWDFIALWKSSELERLQPTEEARTETLRAFFRKHYGDNAQAFGDLHMKVLLALGQYIEIRRPELAKAIERTPNSLAVAVFFLVAEKGIESPTPEQIETVEANQAPRN
jgi:hypothetical protein